MEEDWTTAIAAAGICIAVSVAIVVTGNGGYLWGLGLLALFIIF